MSLSRKFEKLLLRVATLAVTFSMAGGVAAAATTLLPPGNYQAASR
jgi:hypothetical protein